ncbi:hypothetical protein MMC28_005310 [Mycoblastus sanguinarius]|nr:hypothetical protein [Mycoblastus sanguinarius]
MDSTTNNQSLPLILHFEVLPVVLQVQYATITDFVGNYLEATVTAIEGAYNNTTGQDASQVLWTGSSPLRDGFWIDSDYTQSTPTNSLQNMIRILTYKMTKSIGSGVFIIYVPYGRPVKDVSGDLLSAGISEIYCNNNLKDKTNIGTLIICNAPIGMARIFNAGTADGDGDLETTTPKGYDSNFAVLINENFNVVEAIMSSVNS